VQRTALHGALLDAVAAAGVKVVQGVVQANVGEFSQDAMSVRCGGFRARYLAAADGLHSPIRTALGLAVPTNSRRRWGIRRHVQIAPWSDNVEVHWSDDEEAYITPVSDECVGITILSMSELDEITGVSSGAGDVATEVVWIVPVGGHPRRASTPVEPKPGRRGRSAATLESVAWYIKPLLA
jgi:2-polyprenyl-6-methoxyphenol hydroxylase-like FAD-dependent oxidoreductase